jgi:hypothetical protein
MSSAFVPGRILRDASAAPPGNFGEYNERPGEVGPLWSSAMGGGEGSRGDDEGEIGVVIMWETKCETAIKKRLVCVVMYSGQEESGVVSAAFTCSKELLPLGPAPEPEIWAVQRHGQPFTFTYVHFAMSAQTNTRTDFWGDIDRQR